GAGARPSGLRAPLAPRCAWCSRRRGGAGLAALPRAQLPDGGGRLPWAGGRAARLLGHPGGGTGRLTAGDPLVGASDEPVAAGDDETSGSEGDLAELGQAAGVLAPEPGDDVHRLGGAGGELKPRVHGCARLQTEVLGGQAAAQAAGEDLGDEGRCGAARALAAQPAGDRGLVVAQIETVFEAELVDTPGQPGV